MNLAGVGVALVYLGACIGALLGQVPAGQTGRPRWLRALCWTPNLADGILAGVAGLFNPLGVFYVIASALPSTLGANAGLLSLPSIMRRSTRSDEEQMMPIRRSAGWIAAGAVASLSFIVVLGRGITWSR